MLTEYFSANCTRSKCFVVIAALMSSGARSRDAENILMRSLIAALASRFFRTASLVFLVFAGAGRGPLRIRSNVALEKPIGRNVLVFCKPPMIEPWFGALTIWQKVFCHLTWAFASDWSRRQLVKLNDAGWGPLGRLG